MLKIPEKKYENVVNSQIIIMKVKFLPYDYIKSQTFADYVNKITIYFYLMQH